MTLYRYTNTTQQQGADHINHMVAVKVNLVGSPIFTILDETQAAADGTFTLEWGDEATPATENWAGRVMIGAVDDDGAVELDTVFHDWLAGVLVVGVVYTQLDPVQTGTNLSLSNGDLTVTVDVAAQESSSSVDSKLSGKWYWEVTVDSGTTQMVGITDDPAAAKSTHVGATSGGWGMNWNADLYNNNAVAGTVLAFTAGDVVSLALDMVVGKLWFGVNGVWSGDPAAGTGEAVSGLLDAIFAGLTPANSVGNALTANFGGSAFAHTVPAGFNSGLYRVPSNYDLYIENIKATSYYKLDETSGTAVGDSAGSINGTALVGITTGGQIAGGLPATSMDFDGTTQAINLSTFVIDNDEVDVVNDFAIVGWFVPHSDVAQVMIETGSTSQADSSLQIVAGSSWKHDKYPYTTSFNSVQAITVLEPILVIYSEYGADRNYFINGILDKVDSGRYDCTSNPTVETVIGAQRISLSNGLKYNGLMSCMSIHKSKVDLRMAERIWALGRVGTIADWGEGDSASLQDTMTLSVNNTVFTKNTASAVFSRGWSDIYINNTASFYVEVVFTTLASNLDMAVGVSNSNSKTAFDVAGAYMYRTNGFLYTNGNGGVDVSKPAVQGDRLGIAYKNGSMWFRLNGGAWFSGNPATGASPSITGITGDVHFYVCANNGTNQPVLTVAFGKGLMVDNTPATIEEGYYFSGFNEYIPLIAQNAWLMDEASGGLTDHIGDEDAAFTGTPSYGEASIDIRDSAINFNDAYCTATVDVSGGIVTVFGLIKFDTTTNDQVILGLGSAAGDSNNLYYQQATNTFGFNTWNTDIFGVANATTGPADGSWHFVIAEFHTSNFASNLLWIDNAAQVISQVSGTSLNHVLSPNLGIGWSGFSASSQEFEGLLSRVGFMNRATTAEERSNLYQLAIGNTI